MARGTVRPQPKPSLSDISATGLGLVTQSFDSHVGGPTSTALTSQTIYCMSVPVRSGMSVSTAWFNVTQAAAGTVPTSLVVGVCSPTTSLIVSSELKADSAWGTLGFRSVSLGATITFNYTGLAYVMILENGAFASTVLQLGRGSSFGSTLSTNFYYATAGTSQTVLPAAAAAVTLASTGTPLNFWTGLS